MKYVIFLLNMAMLSQAAYCQPVAKADVIALLNALPAAPTNLAEAYQHTYNGADSPNGITYYQATFDQLEVLQREVQRLSLQFYQQNPTGVPAMPQTNGNRVSAKDKVAMDAATSELAQKMLSDPAFAEKFVRMNESEQQAYITKALGEKGLKPAQGQPNTNQAPVPGTDMDWVTPANTFLQAAMDMTRWEKQTALQQKYAAQHDAVNAWTDAEIKKLPLISMGEYGHDHDPVQVKAVQKQGLEKHRQVADAMMKEAAMLFTEIRQQARENARPLNSALQQVSYGERYSFGLHYPLILQTQGAMLSDLQNMLSNEISIMEDVAHWEKEWRDYK